MTKGIEDMLNLPSLSDIIDETDTTENIPEKKISESDVNEIAKAMEKIKNNLELIDNDSFNNELNELNEDIIKHAKDVMDLGFNIDPARAGRIFEVATELYRLGVDVTKLKKEADLKAFKLLLDKQKTDSYSDYVEAKIKKENVVEDDDTILIADRNDIIKKLREKKKD